jgi:hypothetical protein
MASQAGAADTSRWLGVEPVELPLTASIRGLLGIDEQTWPQTVNRFCSVVLAVSGGLSLPSIATVADAELVTATESGSATARAGIHAPRALRLPGSALLRYSFVLAAAAERGYSAGQVPGYIGAMTTLHVPYTIEQDEDGVWCAHAWLGSSGGANGNGATAEEAVADLRKAVRMVIEEDGIPAQLQRSLDLDVA